ncbi:MAG: hypothetical protein ABEJ65_00395 [bacterium]
MDMEVGEMWEAINQSVDWFWAGLITLVVLNLMAIGYFSWVYMGRQDFHTKHNLQPSSIFVQQAQKIEKIPEMEDIKVPPPESSGNLPQKFRQLQHTAMFTPSGLKTVEAPLKTARKDTATKKKKTKKTVKPPIKGFKIVGRVSSPDTVSRVGMIKRLKDQKHLTAREGEYLSNTDVKVVKISDTAIFLDQPDHRVTPFQFKLDKMSERIKKLRGNVERH